jgi:hypothetical protein
MVELKYPNWEAYRESPGGRIYEPDSDNDLTEYNYKRGVFPFGQERDECALAVWLNDVVCSGSKALSGRLALIPGFTIRGPGGRTPLGWAWGATVG